MKKFIALILLSFYAIPIIALANDTITTTGGLTPLLCIAAATPVRTGQSFTTISAGTVTTIQAGLDNQSTAPTDNVIMNVYAVDGSGFPTGASLGSASVPSSAITSTPARVTFTFSSFSLSAATKYAAVFSRDGGASGVNFNCNDGDNSDTYAGGTAMRDNAGTWANLTQDFNLVVTVVTTATGAPYIIDTF